MKTEFDHILVALGFIGLAVILGFSLLGQPASSSPKTQSPTATPTYNPTLGPTTRFRRPVSAKFESRDRSRAVASAWQIEVGPKPSTPSAYTNIVDFMEGYTGNVATQLRQEIANSGGGSGDSGHRIIDLNRAQNLYLGGTSRPGGLPSNQLWATLDYVEGSIVLLEGGQIQWLERPPKGYEFTIILERDIDHIIESFNWNSGWFTTGGTDRGLANTAINSSTGQPNLFPKPPWGQKLRTGDILDVSTPIASQPEAVVRVRSRRPVTLGSEGILNIRQNRWVGQAQGQLVRSVKEMNGAKVLIEDKIPNAGHSVIYLDRLQTPTIFPKGWYIDFFTSQATQNTQNAYGARGQVIFLASDQTITYDVDVTHGPYPQGNWYRLQAVEDDTFHLSILNRDPLPTPTPIPPKRWHAATVNSYQVGSTDINNTCGGAVRNWAAGSAQAGTTSNELGVFNISNPAWQSIKVYIRDAAVNQPAIPGRTAQLIVTHPGTAHSSVTISGTPVPVRQNRYPVFRRWGVELTKVEDNRVWMYIYDGQRGERGVLGSDFDKPDVSSELRCFSLVQEYR